MFSLGARRSGIRAASSSNLPAVIEGQFDTVVYVAPGARQPTRIASRCAKIATPTTTSYPRAGAPAQVGDVQWTARLRLR